MIRIHVEDVFFSYEPGTTWRIKKKIKISEKILLTIDEAALLSNIR